MAMTTSTRKNGMDSSRGLPLFGCGPPILMAAEGGQRLTGGAWYRGRVLARPPADPPVEPGPFSRPPRILGETAEHWLRG